jgi:hypothetical protein
MIPSLLTKSKQTTRNPDKPQSQGVPGVYKSRVPACFALHCFDVRSHSTCNLQLADEGFLDSALEVYKYGRHMTLLSGRHTSAVVAASPFCSTFYITPFDNCFMDPQLPYTTAVLVTAFLSKPPSEQAAWS